MWTSGQQHVGTRPGSSYSKGNRRVYFLSTYPAEAFARAGRDSHVRAALRTSIYTGAASIVGRWRLQELRLAGDDSADFLRGTSRNLLARSSRHSPLAPQYYSAGSSGLCIVRKLRSRLRDLIRDVLAAIKSDPPYKAECSCTTHAASAPTLHQVMQTSGLLPHVAPISAVSSNPQSYFVLLNSLAALLLLWCPGHISRFCRRRQQDERHRYSMYARRGTSPFLLWATCL